MATTYDSNNLCCPCLGLVDDPEAHQSRPSGQHRCYAIGAARAVSFHRQTTSCLTSGFARCPDFRHQPPEPDEEEEAEPARRGVSFGSVDATLSEGALLFLMMGMIVFALFALAPRPAPAAIERDTAPAATPGVVAAAAETGVQPTAIATQTAATQVPAPTPAAAPPTRVPTKAPTRVATAAPTPSSGKTYEVRAGDTLYSIARTLGVTVDALSKANGLTDPSKLKAGQKLRVP